MTHHRVFFITFLEIFFHDFFNAAIAFIDCGLRHSSGLCDFLLCMAKYKEEEQQLQVLLAQ